MYLVYLDIGMHYFLLAIIIRYIFCFIRNSFIRLKVCLHVKIFSLCLLLSPIKFSIVPMLMELIMDKKGDQPIFFLLF